MIDIQDRRRQPALEELFPLVGGGLLEGFHRHLKDTYQALCGIQYSGCCGMPGWNILYRKAGRSLCRVYPREGYMVVLVVIGPKEKEGAEALLPALSVPMRDLYHNTQEGMGQKWLMAEVGEEGPMLEDVKRLIALRRGKAG